MKQKIKFTCKTCKLSETFDIDLERNKIYLANIKKRGVMCSECYDKKVTTITQELRSKQPIFYTKATLARYK